MKKPVLSAVLLAFAALVVLGGFVVVLGVARLIWWFYA